jgi:hypothetical protein
MLKKTLWTLFVVIIVGPAPSAVRAQGPGMFNPGRGGPALRPRGGGVGANGGMKSPVAGPFVPPAVPGFVDQEKRRDDQDPWNMTHIIGHGISHGIPSSHGPDFGPRANQYAPKVVPPAAEVGASEFRSVPTSEFRYTPPRFTPALGEGGSGIARALSGAKGRGILGGIGAALAAAFGALFGRKKES